MGTDLTASASLIEVVTGGDRSKYFVILKACGIDTAEWLVPLQTDFSNLQAR